MSEAARSRRDDTRYEPTLAVPGREAKASDPLAELARLVGQDDPYRDVFRPVPAAAPQVSRHEEPQHSYEEGALQSGIHDPYRGHDNAHAEPEGLDDYAHDPATRYVDEHDAAATGEHYQDDSYAAEAYAHADDAGLTQQLAAPAQLPDMWARGQDQGPGSAPSIDRDPSVLDRGEARSSARRPVAVLGAVLLLTVGGLAATFLAKGSSSASVASSASSKGAPTIMAATGPTKVKMDDNSATAPEDQDAALLSKSGAVSSGPVKIVSSQEQPADLGQLPKSDLADGARPLPSPSASPFPEPKKVKTFLVHPDGTMLSGDPAPSGTRPSSPVAAAAAAALPATPKTAARGGTTPQAPAATASIASLVADPVPTDTAPVVTPAKPARQAASPGVRQASAKPSDTADAPSTGGGYGVQLASSPNEADANAAFAKLKKKYPTQLGSYSASVHKAETGDKPVYRVRIGGMAQDEAKSLCSQLQTAGGSCFVMHN
ncbi:MAG: SPOR domain-containing protein [Janthinobacterium lividum]